MIIKTVLEELKDKNIEDSNTEKDTQYFDEEFTPYWERESYHMNREDLRDFWAKILVQEILHPHSVSIRTMEFVKTLSKRDANIFNMILPYVLHGNVLPKIYNILNTIDLQHLEHLGFILSDRMCTLKKSTRLSNKCAITVEKEVQFNVYSLSDIGKELYAIADVGECDFDKLEEIFDNESQINIGDKINFHRMINLMECETQPFRIYKKNIQKNDIVEKYNESLPRLSLEPNV